MINKSMFDNANIISKALDASWMRNQVIAENLANVDTPGYKRKDVEFETYLKTALMTNNKSDMTLHKLKPKIVIDKANLSYRLDGNNVNIDTEMVELSKNQIRYSTLVDQVKHNFSRIKMVLSR